MQNKIDPQSTSYWHAILDLVHLENTSYENGLAKFIHQEYKSSRFEHLNINSTSSLFSFRLNASARVLCTEITVDGKNYLLILEHVPNHDYEKARFKHRVYVDPVFGQH